jgi:hypothetical protein
VASRRKNGKTSTAFSKREDALFQKESQKAILENSKNTCDGTFLEECEEATKTRARREHRATQAGRPCILPTANQGGHYERGEARYRQRNRRRREKEKLEQSDKRGRNAK